MISKRDARSILGLSGNPSLDDVTFHFQQLSLHWHPSNNDLSPESIKNFEALCRAYLVLTGGRDHTDERLTQMKMCEVFGSVFGLEGWAALSPFLCSCPVCHNNVGQGQDTGSSDDATGASETPAVQDQGAAASQMPESTTAGAAQTFQKDTNMNEGAVGFSSQAEALLQKLQPQKKLSKKAAKKQRRKQRQMQQNQPGSTQDDGRDESGSSDDSEDEKSGAEEEDLDLNSAFVLMSRKATKAGGAIPKTSVASAKTREDAAKQGRKLAEEGFELCLLSRYKEAITMFTQAIKLCPNDYISYGNRSFCYCSLERYDKALYDAEKAVSLQPSMPKGYFRRGKAQLGLQRYREAANSFKTVLALDPKCHEARSELHSVHVYELLGMGFNDEQAEWALSVGGEEIQKAVDALCGHGAMKADTKMNPCNLEGLCSLWVGNVRTQVTEKMLYNLFHRYGEIQSMRLMSDKFCAFINYSNKLSPSKAMEALQGYELCGSNLLIRFPDNPVTDTNGQHTVLKKSSLRVVEPNQSLQPKDKAAGPGKVKECLYWRFGGCTYGGRCFYQHVPEHKGIDRKTPDNPK